MPTRPTAARASPRPPRTRAEKTTEPTAPVPRFSVGYMDRSADPSQDFYRFANGTWIDRNPVPANKTRWGAFDELTENNLRQVRGIVEGASKARRGTRPTPRGQVGDFFASAMDTDRREAAGFGPIERDDRAIRAISSRLDLVKAMAGLHRWGIPGGFHAAVAPDEKNSSVYALYLYQGGLSLPDRDYYLKEEFAPIIKAYRAHIAAAFTLWGESADRAARNATTVLAIETELARSSRTRTELRDPEKNYNRTTPAELIRRNPALRWKEYLSARGASRTPYVVVGQPEFFDALDRLVGARPLPEWKVYLRWQLLHSSAAYLHAAADREDFEFFRHRLLGQQEPEPAWKRAAMAIDGAIGEALGRLYVQRFFPAEARARMIELVQDLREVFQGRLRGVPWMTEETRRLALVKFDRFTTKIGHPKRFRDYSKVRVSRRDYLGNVRRAEAFEIQRMFKRIGRPVDRTEWQMTPPTVNAYFDPTLNEIVFPAGILQPPFFDPQMDDAVNYGGIGVVIGHEITHGYDDQGRKFDADGNMRDWWQAADATEFQRRAQGIIDQYSEFEALPGAHVNGALTAGENIADLGGVGIAYEALQRRIARGRTPSEKIEGLTPAQRFFLSYAQIWRANTREPEMRRRLTIDPHSPGRFRAIGAVTNLPEFWAAFGVAEGAPMRRSDDRRVSIW